MMENRKSSLIFIFVLDAIIMIIAFLFWPRSDRVVQSNDLDRTKTQIQIKTKRLNIRENPSIDSEDLGDVYEGEIYTVLSHKEDENYYWYHITTKNGIDGYIASSPDGDYISLLSGFIDRNPPTIYFENDFIEIVNDEYLFDSVTCEDDHTNCGLSYEINSPEYASFKAVDDDGNTVVREIKYYKVYNLYSEYYDNSRTINAKFTKKKNNDSYVIGTTYIINKEIPSDSKSTNYYPVIDFFDEHFNKLNDIYVSINELELAASCMNDSNNTLKEEYSDTNLLKGNSICMNFSFDNKDKLIKYIAVGFTGDENSSDSANILSFYYSKYFVI